MVIWVGLKPSVVKFRYLGYKYIPGVCLCIYLILGFIQFNFRGRGLEFQYLGRY